jgi:hypothetical protein
MKRLTEKEFFDRLKYFGVSKHEFLKILSFNCSDPKRSLKYSLLYRKSYRVVIKYILTWYNTPQGYDFWEYICNNIDQVKISFKNQINKIKIK